MLILKSANHSTPYISKCGFIRKAIIMKTITFNSAQCGSGKTRDDLIPRIQKNYLNNKKTLILGPSNNYQNQLKDNLENNKFSVPTSVINCLNKKDSSVVSQLVNSMMDGDPVISITSYAFVLTPWFKKTEYDLIIDESFDVVEKIKIKNKNDPKWDPKLRLEQLFGLNSYDSEVVRLDPETDESFIKLHRNFDYGENIVTSSPIFRSLMNPNYEVYTTPNSYNRMVNQEDGEIRFYLMFKAEIFDLFNSVHIASARFETTFLYYLLNKHYKLETQVPFTPHKINGKIHCYKDSQVKFKSSKSMNTKHPELITNMLNYATSLDSKSLVLANSNVVVPDNFIKLTHNCHGMNTPEMMETTTVAILSAIVMSPDIKKFVKELLLDEVDGNLDKIIERAHFINTAYQSIMRNKIRSRDYNMEEINIVVMDEDVGSLLVEYFDFINIETAVVEIPLPELIKTEIVTEMKTAKKRKSKKVAMTPAERKRNQRQREKMSRIRPLEDTSKAINVTPDNCENTSGASLDSDYPLPIGRVTSGQIIKNKVSKEINALLHKKEPKAINQVQPNRKTLQKLLSIITVNNKE